MLDLDFLEYLIEFDFGLKNERIWVFYMLIFCIDCLFWNFILFFLVLLLIFFKVD